MILGQSAGGACERGCRAIRNFILVLLAGAALPLTVEALPRRLVLALDGVAYRDMKALQEGVDYADLKGRRFHRQAFHRGYFPASRLISTFPSASDVAWTEIFGNRPLPGYQRTYYCEAANAAVSINGVTTTMEYERQMHWQTDGGVPRAMGYVFPRTAFKIEVRELVASFLDSASQDDTYYALIRATDDAQHLSADIYVLLCRLDQQLEELRAEYKRREGRELEILVLSDHANNHAGPAKRVEIRSFLKKAGYRVAQSIVGPKDVVLPTAGMESWVEIHNAPVETERLAGLLTHLEGVDLVTARLPGGSDRFIVLNSKGARAVIDWNRARDAFRYSAQTGDPLDYGPAVEALGRKHQIDAAGFAPADAWLAETLAHRYPLALERIARAHTQVTLNPATILISLSNDYLHADWLIKEGSDLVRFGGTHGGLDDLNSTGMLLSSFRPTTDTSSRRVATLFDGFPGVRNYRAAESGSEWVSGKGQGLTRIARGPLDGTSGALPGDGVFLRVWAPSLAALGSAAPLEATFRKVPRFPSAPIRRADRRPTDANERRVALEVLPSFREDCPQERVYALPRELGLEPRHAYSISGRVRDGKKTSGLFSFAFRTDSRGQPIAY